MKNHVVRPVIPLKNIFSDDPVRMIRAVKASATTGFRLPLQVKWKIRQQNGLLAGVSPSRLTEEIFKIIHSSQAAEIADHLDSGGLFQYLQPRAVELFKSRAGFRERYMKTLSTLNKPGFKDLPGEALAGLVRDYLEDEADWTGVDTGEAEDGEPIKTPSERYKEAFALARQFVLPMNPPRAELGHALRLLFAEHGVTIRRGRFAEEVGRSERDRRPAKNAGANTTTLGADGEKDAQAPDAGARKRKRRRRPRGGKRAKPAETQTGE
jgi:poly(A) polymerase